MAVANDEREDGGEEADDTPADSAERRSTQLRARAAVVVTSIVVVIVVLLLPIAASSLINQLGTTGVAPAFNVLTGQALDLNRQSPAPLDVTYANFDVSNIDEATQAATIIVSGNRVCHAACLPINVTLYSLSPPDSLTRGLPPSASFEVAGQDGVISSKVTLPVSGDPQRYPFDTYTLLFGISLQATEPDKSVRPLTSDELAATTELTLSSTVGRLRMSEPHLLDVSQFSAPGVTRPYVSVLQLEYTRPVWLEILSMLLILLISISGFLALFMRDLSELSLGIGGIILGVWGIRSVVIQGDLPAVTIVDTLLALVILVLLLAMAIRATVHFWGQARGA